MFKCVNNQAQNNKKSWAFETSKFFISNQLHHLANFDHLRLAQMTKFKFRCRIVDAEEVGWLTSINRGEAQQGVDILLRPHSTFKVSSIVK